MSKVFEMIEKERERQKNNVELIASENFVSDDVLSAMSSCLTNKYAEGYSGKRYYGGCEFVDEVESYCQQMWKKAFQTDYHCNVQPHSGSNANFAAYMALIQPGERAIGMDLDNGGHLTHGSPVNFSGKIFDFKSYGVLPDGKIDYCGLREIAMQDKPKVIVSGASAYPRIIDFEAIRRICDDCGAYMLVDMSHIAGLVLAGEHPSPFGLADVITTTTHKTLRGPRGGMIFCKPELQRKVDSAVFPGTQGGPLEHIIAAKAVCAEEACAPEYKTYIRQVVLNARAMAERFVENGFELVTGGTDNHLFLVDFTRTHPELTGLEAQNTLDAAGITANKNCVPGEKRKPQLASGLRIGSPAMTTKGWREDDFIRCADTISELLKPWKV